MQVLNLEDEIINMLAPPSLVKKKIYCRRRNFFKSLNKYPSRSFLMSYQWYKCVIKMKSFHHYWNLYVLEKFNRSIFLISNSPKLSAYFLNIHIYFTFYLHRIQKSLTPGLNCEYERLEHVNKCL